MITPKRNLFSGPSTRALYGNTLVVNNPGSAARGEIDLRKELDELFFGYSNGIGHANLCLLRKLRTDANGAKLPCTCKNTFTKDADPDCSYCNGEGWLYDERWEYTMSQYSGADSGLASRVTYLPPGHTRVDYKIFYFRYTVDVEYGDKIVDIKLDDNGKPVVPLKRESIYQPQTIINYRSDNARKEYVAVYCRESDALRLDR